MVTPGNYKKKVLDTNIPMSNNMQLTHYLITRFNIIQEWYFSCAKQGRGTQIQTSEWLKNRFYLFERYCFPSVRAQSAEFIWLVLFNSETPKVYRKRIESYKKKMSNFVPIYIKPYGDEVEAIKDYISTHCKSDMLLTTRCDNDDMLHVDFMLWLQKNCQPTTSRKILNYTLGYQYDEREKTLYTMYYHDNHFFSVLEPFTADYHTCLGMNHSKLSQCREYGEYVELAAKDSGWIELIHSLNVANRRLILKPNMIYSRSKFPKLQLSIINYIKAWIRYRYCKHSAFYERLWLINKIKHNEYIFSYLKRWIM